MNFDFLKDNYSLRVDRYSCLILNCLNPCHYCFIRFQERLTTAKIELLSFADLAIANYSLILQEATVKLQ